jgi:hypothetical protein
MSTFRLHFLEGSPGTNWFLGSAGGERVHFFGYLSGFVHCFVGYWIAFRHVLVLDLGCFGAGFLEIRGKRGLIGVPPPPPSVM